MTEPQRISQLVCPFCDHYMKVDSVIEADEDSCRVYIKCDSCPASGQAEFTFNRGVVEKNA